MYLPSFTTCIVVIETVKQFILSRVKKSKHYTQEFVMENGRIINKIIFWGVNGISYFSNIGLRSYFKEFMKAVTTLYLLVSK